MVHVYPNGKIRRLSDRPSLPKGVFAKKTPLPKPEIWGNQTPFGWGIGRAKGDRLLRSGAVHDCPKRQKNVAFTYILQAARTRMRIAHQKAGRKGIFKGNSNSKPKAKTNSSEQAWNYSPGFFLGFISSPDD
ncbi:hypothetical protein HW132_10040 [Brasilonema sp. CT11]|nr:hypothetical protein [Brasilonema sp. CT11]